MRRGTMRYFFSLCFVLGAAGFSLFDLQNSYVQFERWRTAADGKIGISFRCKTYVKTGLLLYADDQGDGEYLALYLRDGFLVLELSDETSKVFKARSKVIINDLQWHRIEVELSPHRAAFRLDNATQDDFNITKTQLKSNVFVGGFPHDMDIFLLSHDVISFEERFLGCVEDLKFSSKVKGGNYTESSAKIVKSSGVDLECKDACKPVNLCRNGGVCMNKFAKAECLCAGTGYRGSTCEAESPVVGISSSDHRVIFGVLSSYIASSPETTSMFVRFRSTQPDGVFFYTAYNGDYVILELANGRVTVSVNLGSGSVTIATKKNAYNDNQWHRVKIERVKRLVNLTVDNSDTANGETRGVFDKFHLPNKKTSFVLGGLVDDRKTKLKTVSRKNFTGCLQELVFNGYDLFSKFNSSAKEIMARGIILKTCPKPPTTPPQVVTTVKTDVVDRSTKPSTSASVFSSTSAATTNKSLPCILAGISCRNTTADVPTSQAQVVTLAQQTSTDTLSSTGGKRVSTDDQSTTTIKTRTQSTVGTQTFTGTSRTSTSKTTPGTSKNSQDLSTDKNIQGTTSRSSPTSIKVSRSNGILQTTGEVIMAKRNERSEGDLTVWFIIAAVVGLVAFLLAILIIVKVNSTNRRKYAVKGKKYDKDYWADTGSFQRPTKPLV